MTTAQQWNTERGNTILAVCENYKIDEDAFLAWCDNLHINSNYEDEVEAFTDYYVGCYDSFLTFATGLFDDTMFIPDEIAGYIDYEAWARDLIIAGDYWTHDDPAHGVVYVFANH